MKKNFFSLFSLLLFLQVFAQHKVTFIVKEKTGIHHDQIYITGTFADWDSMANKRNLMQPHGTHEKSIVFNLPSGVIRYKYTRGGWLTVEKHLNGTEVSDRTLDIKKDTVLIDSVEGWRDEILADKMVLLQQTNEDTTRLALLSSMAFNYAFLTEYFNPDSALHYAQAAILLYQKITASDEYKAWTQSDHAFEIFGLQEVFATLLHSLGNYPKSLEIRFENVKLAEKGKDKFLIVRTMRNVTTDYSSMRDYNNVLKYGKQMDSILNTISLKDPVYLEQEYFTKMIIAEAFYNLNQFDSALSYVPKTKNINAFQNNLGFQAFSMRLLGDIYAAKGSNDSAFICYQRALDGGEHMSAQQLVGGALSGIAKIFKNEGRNDSALIYARRAMLNFQTNKKTIQSWGENSDSYIADLAPLLADLYQANNQSDSAYKYLRLSITIKDSLYNDGKVREFQTLSFNEAVRRQQLEQQSKIAEQTFATKVKMYSLITIIVAILVLAFILHRNNKQKQKANGLLQLQKQEIETTLSELKSTQKQLIQSEKMASLGELTAGIAHEIQNPLNFVNNFSEVNTELIDEAKQLSRESGNEPLQSILNDLWENEQKILHHGKRADSIVKGMLQHSRNSGGAKEPVSINSLADEYFRLSYHGLRAKDKTFNSSLKTDFDDTIGAITIVPEEIGRVLLNLFNNAFYSVAEKKKEMGKAYEPLVAVSTKKITASQGGELVEIRLKDNGKGISKEVIDKIFQPFFTTKPSGQGTGLGLSLSYDIIKAHGGELKVESALNQGAEFIILLPAA